MRSSKLAALAAISLVVGSSAASAQTAPSAAPAATSPAARAGAPVTDADALRGTTAWILAAIALGLIIWGGIELLGDDEEDFPTSP